MAPTPTSSRARNQWVLGNCDSQPLSGLATEQSVGAGPRWRRWLAWAALVLGCLVLLIANVAVFARIIVLAL